MSVLIKGMEMPKSCEKCPCKTADAFGGLGCQATGYIPLRKANQDRPDWCPLVEIPPHGRLIDADALEAQCDDPYWCVWLTDIKDAPTIIESTIGQLNSDSAVNEANANTSNAFNALDCVEESEAFR